MNTENLKDLDFYQPNTIINSNEIFLRLHFIDFVTKIIRFLIYKKESSSNRPPKILFLQSRIINYASNIATFLIVEILMFICFYCFNNFLYQHNTQINTLLPLLAHGVVYFSFYTIEVIMLAIPLKVFIDDIFVIVKSSCIPENQSKASELLTGKYKDKNLEDVVEIQSADTSSSHIKVIFEHNHKYYSDIFRLPIPSGQESRGKNYHSYFKYNCQDTQIYIRDKNRIFYYSNIPTKLIPIDEYIEECASFIIEHAVKHAMDIKAHIDRKIDEQENAKHKAEQEELNAPINIKSYS